MNIGRTSIILCLITLFCFLTVPAPLCAQDEQQGRAAWQVSRFDITANVSLTDRSLTSRALLSARNVGSGAGSTFTVRINQKAEIKSASVNEQSAAFRSSPEKRGNLQRVTITLPTSVQPGASVSVVIDYRLPVTENTGLAAISPVETQFLPLSFWYPAPNTPFSPGGADVAPVRLTVNAQGAETIVASGKASGSTFEQPLSGQPFFLAGSWESSESSAAEARGISAYFPKGASAEERKQAEAVIALAASARSFYAGFLGNAPDVPVRLVAATRGAGTSGTGLMLLDAAVFRRAKIDAATALAVAEGVARLWVGGATPVRGDGSGVLSEGLTRYLANAFLEKQFGREAADAERLRQRIAYAAVARRDAPLATSTPLDDTYFTSVPNKGAMIWRLVERALGQQPFMSTLRAQLQTGTTDARGLTLASLRAALSERGDAVKTILDQGLDQPTDMDLMVGLPQQRGGQWVSALRNVGAFDATVTVAATTATGERVTTEATIPARSFGEAVFKTTASIVRAEVDPDKLYPQLDYSNDIAPRARALEEALVEARTMLARGENARVEATAREMIRLAPRMQEAHILLARALLAESKLEEAEREFRAALDERLPQPVTLAWGSIGLGEVALRKGQAAEAAKRFNEAVRADAEYAATLAGRAGRIRAEAAANSAPAIDESVRAFIAQLDTAIKGGRKAEIDALIVSGELVDFAKGIVGSQPEIWQTRPLRTEQLDAIRMAVDVNITARQLGRDSSGTAVLILVRSGNGWKLGGIELFEVR